jgi:hypothetical protein
VKEARNKKKDPRSNVACFNFLEKDCFAIARNDDFLNIVCNNDLLSEKNFNNCLLKIANRKLPTKYCLLPTENCQLDTANRKLPTENCLLKTENCLLIK